MHNKAKPAFIYYTPAIGWGILICYFSLMSSAELPNMLVSVRDFILHFTIYAALAWLAYFGQNKFTRQKLPFKNLLIIIAACLLLGLCLEILQELFAKGRHFEVIDILFNSMGTLLILVLHFKITTGKL